MDAVEQDQNQGWLTRERILTLVLAAATLMALYACWLMIAPFLSSLAFALALTVVTQRPYRWLRQRLHGDTLAAAVATLLVAVLIIAPIAFLGTYLVQQALDSVNEFRSGGLEGVRTSLENHPRVGPAMRWLESRVDLENQVRTLGQQIAGQATNLLKGSVNVVTSLVITLFVLFFLYRDRRDAMEAACKLMPLAQGEANRLFSRIGDTIVATVSGSLTVAAVQATLAGLMYGFLGVPGAVLWAAATFIMALIPVFGTFMVWGPIAAYLAVTGSYTKAAILVGWGMLAVGTIDNFLYPFLVGDRLRIHTVPTFFAILGGITVFGASGLILGPLILAVSIGLIDVWWRRTAQGHSAEEAVANTSASQVPPEQALEERGVEKL